MTKVRWEEMYPDELLEAIREHRVCFAAYGLAEPHGAYNALGLDWLKAQALAERAAAELGGVVAPPFAWHSHERQIFPWLEENGVEQSLCSAIPAELFLQMVLYQIRAIDARGFHAAILITGHYGGVEQDMRLLCDFYLRRTKSPLQVHAAADWEFIRFEDYHGDHGGICETAQLMALKRELVDLQRTDSESPNGPWIGTQFPLSDGRMPTRELGESIVRSQIERLGEVRSELLAAYVPNPDVSAPSLLDVADIWHRFEALTRKYWWSSFTCDENKQNLGQVRFPGWEALGE